MKGDFSRDTYDRAKHFSRVLQQQGRVQLDADWNEQTAILIHYMRTLAADLIGPFAGPKDSKGFEISPVTDGDFIIGAGRYYVDGILCENEKEDVTYRNQKDHPAPPTLGTEKSYLVYLDVWERHISALEDDYIREKALGGPDTATRTKVVWQVKIDGGERHASGNLDLGTAEAVHKSWKDWIALWQPPHLGCLNVRVKRPEADSNDPCITAPDAKYRGQENQLYRVEIHKDGGAGEASFKWSRDNGAIVTSCELSGVDLTVHNPRGFVANQWVELTNEGQELRGEYGTLVKLLKVEGEVLTVASAPSPAIPIPGDEKWPTKVRRWDQSEKGEVKLVNGAVLVKEGGWIDLEDGIEIQFMPIKTKGEAHRYRTGDYWLIPARVSTGDIEWPVEHKDGIIVPIFQPPVGIRHHYAPLAIMKRNEREPQDCRCEFVPLNDCEKVSSGIDGIGGSPLCATPTLRPASKASAKSKGVDDPATLRRGKPK